MGRKHNHLAKYSAGFDSNGRHVEGKEKDSVVERLEKLRYSERRPGSNDILHHAHAFHPEIARFLDVPAKVQVKPRIGTSPSRRRIPGPAAPASWLMADRNLPLRTTNAASPQSSRSSFDVSWKTSSLPPYDSLTYQCLKKIALEWKLHVTYIGEDLAYLPAALKSGLTSLIAEFGTPLRLTDVFLLFPEHESHEIDALDFGNAEMSLGQLRSIFLPRLCYKRDGAHREAHDEDQLNDVEGRADNKQLFPSLTRLSVEKPRHPNWTGLLRLILAVPTLAYLSIAYWPRPEISTLLEFTRLSICLKQLDVSGCSWAADLNAVEWNGYWRGMTLLKLQDVPEQTIFILRHHVPRRVRFES